MRALTQPHMQLGRHDGRAARGQRATVELLRTIDAQGPQLRLLETYRTHAATGILPARRSYVLKRSLDLALAIPALLLTFPLYPLITVLIRLDSPGPALYRQVRIGKDGRPFVVYKFRTMRQAPPEQAHAAHLEIVAKWMNGVPLDVVVVSSAASLVPSGADVASSRAETSSHPLMGEPALSSHPRWRRRQREKPFVVGSPFKHQADPRITRVGRILRKLSIDELPQLINVVQGEMSLVGPRPPMADEVERYSERALARLRVPPGITGQWQVDGRGRVSFDGMVEMDLDYAVHGSLWRDISLLLRTIPAVLRCSGAG